MSVKNQWKTNKGPNYEHIHNNFQPIIFCPPYIRRNGLYIRLGFLYVLYLCCQWKAESRLGVSVSNVKRRNNVSGTLSGLTQSECGALIKPKQCSGSRLLVKHSKWKAAVHKETNYTAAGNLIQPFSSVLEKRKKRTKKKTSAIQLTWIRRITLLQTRERHRSWNGNKKLLHNQMEFNYSAECLHKVRE